MRPVPLALFGLLTLPLPALADGMVCAFDTECIDDAPCSATDYAVDLRFEEMAAELVTPAETLDGRAGLTGDGALFFVAVTDTAVHLLTMMDEAGTARYTVHLPGAGMAIGYLGRCARD